MPSPLRIAIGVAPTSLDPWRVTTTMQANLIDYVVETLVRIDSTGAIVPGLATSWTISPDGRTLSLSLRDGVVFHDLSPLTASDVKWNLARLTTTNLQAFGRMPDPYALIDSVEVAGPRSIRISLRGAAAARLLDELSTTHTAIISPRSIGQHGNAYDSITHPIGTGSYKYARYLPGQRLVLDRFDEYWGRKATFPSLEFVFQPTAAARFSSFKARDAHVIVSPDFAQLADVDSIGGNVVQARSNRSIFIGFDTRRPPFNDPRVRRALNHAIDKIAIIRTVLGGAADVMDAPMARGLAGYCRTGSYGFDVHLAERLLREAGVRSGTRIELLSPRGRYAQDAEVADAVADYIRKVGMDVSVRVIDDWSSYLDAVSQKETSALPRLHLFGWAPSVPNAASQFEVFSSRNWPPFGAATTYYKNERVDTLIARSASEVETSASRWLACEAARIIWDDAPWIFLWTQRFPILHSRHLTGLAILPNEKVFVSHAKWQ